MILVDKFKFMIERSQVDVEDIKITKIATYKIDKLNSFYLKHY